MKADIKEVYCMVLIHTDDQHLGVWWNGCVYIDRYGLAQLQRSSNVFEQSWYIPCVAYQDDYILIANSVDKAIS